MSSAARPDRFVRSLERGLAVLQAFSRDQPVLTISDAARQTGPDKILESSLKAINLERRTKRSTTDSGLLLKALKEAKSQRWAVVDEELEDHIRSIAVPLCDAGGITIAALSVWVQWLTGVSKGTPQSRPAAPP